MARQTRSQHTGQFTGTNKTPAETRRAWAKAAISIFEASRARSIANIRYIPTSYDMTMSMDVLMLSEIMLALAENGIPLADLVDKAKAVAMLQRLADS